MNTAPNICHIDATGLLCPEPLLLLKQSVKQLQSGDVVHITVTDEHAELDFEIWCERFGHGLKKIDESDQRWVFAIISGGVNQP